MYILDSAPCQKRITILCFHNSYHDTLRESFKFQNELLYRHSMSINNYIRVCLRSEEHYLNYLTHITESIFSFRKEKELYKRNSIGYKSIRIIKLYNRGDGNMRSFYSNMRRFFSIVS